VARHRPGETLEQLVARADAVMLQAKRRGRNMVLRAESAAPAFSEDGTPGA
jgi:PleD family two-component response regulator